LAKIDKIVEKCTNVENYGDVQAIINDEASPKSLAKLDKFSQDSGLKNFQEFLLMNLKYQ